MPPVPTIQIRRLPVGAEVRGLDLSVPLAARDLETLRRTHAEHGALFFRDQDLTPRQHVAFAESWGKIHVHPHFASVPGHPRIALLVKEPDEKVNVGGNWHTDNSYAEIPNMGVILCARQLPTRGGDTLFASMYTAYETLPSDLKNTLRGLQAVHSSGYRAPGFVLRGQRRDSVPTAGAWQVGAARRMEEGVLRLPRRIPHREALARRAWHRHVRHAVHPVVVSHPLSGRKALYVVPGRTKRFVGWSSKDSAPLLRALFEHAFRPESIFRFRWERGSIAFWDNRCTWHYALNDYHGQRRVMHRITLEGDALSGA